MPLTPETLTRHELNGLPVRVVDAPNPDLVGIEGRVVAETQGTLSVASADRVRQVPKQGSTFEFALTDESAGVEKAPGTAFKRGSETAGVRSGQSGPCESVAYVTVDGARLLSRPALRTEKAGDSKWQ
ncbi:ribonuclease P protein component 1 [Halorussus caseinilyticus]|uniref:ribonuclease P protein component 1 n=1 Tax=Halorussus caseinilyticus TaxID=3034025 RepID=UPI0023E7A067|nr:ribonuclease P protein component 1 [Halorussus sp. DT72]